MLYLTKGLRNFVNYSVILNLQIMGAELSYNIPNFHCTISSAGG